MVIASSISPFYILFKVLGFRGFQKLTSYVEERTPYHSIHPLTKLLIALIVTVVCAESVWWVDFAIGTASRYFYYRLRRVRLIISFSALQMVSTVLDSSYFVSPVVLHEIFGDHLTVIWKFPSYFVYMGFVPDLTLQALIYSFQVSMRVWSMLMYSVLIFQTTTPSKIISSFHRMKVPMPITFAVTVGLVSLPRMFDTAETVFKLQLMKGTGKGKAFKLFHVLRAEFESVVPLLIYEFRKAKTVSISAETRGFMAYKSRTYVEETPFSRTDKAVSAFMLSILVVDTYLVSIGLIPAIPFHP